jgi:hypothetical protein
MAAVLLFADLLQPPPRPDELQGKILNAFGLSLPLKPKVVKRATQAEAHFSESPIFK